MGKLLRNRRLVCRRTDRFTVRRHNLIADIPIGDGAVQAGEAFATPTIVHFGAVLLLAAVLSAPWHGIAPAAALWGLLGLSGVMYAAIVARRLQRQTAYKCCRLRDM
jgi:hypothetical protein